MINRSDSNNKDIASLAAFQSNTSVSTKPSATSTSDSKKRTREEEKGEAELNSSTNGKVSNVGQRLLNTPSIRWTDEEVAELMAAHASVEFRPINKGDGFPWLKVKDLLPKNKTIPQCSQKIFNLKKTKRFAYLLAIATHNAMLSSSSSSSSSLQTIPLQSGESTKHGKWTPDDDKIILKAIENEKTWKKLIPDFPNRTQLALKGRFNQLKMYPQPEAPPKTYEWADEDVKKLCTYIKENRNAKSGRIDWSEIESTGLLKNRAIGTIRGKAKQILDKHPELITRTSSPVPILSKADPSSLINEEAASS